MDASKQIISIHLVITPTIRDSNKFMYCYDGATYLHVFATCSQPKKKAKSACFAFFCHCKKKGGGYRFNGGAQTDRNKKK